MVARASSQRQALVAKASEAFTRHARIIAATGPRVEEVATKTAMVAHRVQNACSREAVALWENADAVSES